MAEIVGAFLGAALQVAQWVSKPISRQFNYLCCFTTNIDDLKHEDQKLKVATRGLQGRVNTAIDNVEVVFPEVLTWLGNANDIEEQTTSILDEVPNVKSGCLKLRARFSLSRRAKKTIDRMKVLQDKGNFADISERGPPAAREAVSLGTTYEFESRKQIKEEMMTTLRDEDVNMIGICGMGGLGKTTMAKQIMNKVLEEQVFQEAVIVVFSQQVDKSKIQNEIAGQLGLNLNEETSEANRAQKLRKRLSSGTKRILLVLDDVWEGFEVHEFGIPCDAKGCTIFITSRNKSALHAMKGVQMIFEMDELSEEEAWFLFEQRAGICVDHSESINSIAHEVVEECRGLPIALITVGAVLREETDVRNWRDTLRQLSRSDPDIPEVIANVYNPLKLSYDVLSPKAKFVFMLCCLFPEDADIPVEELTYFYMGLRKFEGIGNVEEEMDRMHALTKLLKSRCLLLSGEDESHVRMHDVVRDVCIFIAKQERYIGGNDCKWISSHQLPIGSEFPNLHLLFLRWNSDLSLLEGSRDLRVLSIDVDYSMRSLPHTTQSLANLTTLKLISCRGLETISVVGELVNLEILICRNCDSIEELPPKMKGLNRLKLLDLTECGKLKRIGRGIISSLIELEELKLVDSFSNWEAENAEVKENAGLTELAALTNLTCLQIDISDTALAAEQILISSKMQRFQIRICDRLRKFDKSLALKLRGEICLGDWILQLLRDTELLKLSGNGANNVDLVNSQNIRLLDLEMCDTIKNVVRTSYGDGDGDATVFPFIEYLKLLELPQLQEICDGPISSTSFHNLKELCLYHCDRLRNLGQLSIGGKDCLPQLQVIDIKDCEMMEQVFLWNEENQTRNNSESRSQQVVTKVFPKLRKVGLHRLPNLETFYQGIEGIESPLLETMDIRKCPKMKFIRSNESSGSSSSATIDDDSAHLFYKVSFGNLESLKTDMNPFWGHKFRLPHFDGLVELTFYKVNGCKSLIPSSVAINLLKLTELKITKCDEMVKVIEDKEEKEKVVSGGERAILFPKLEELYLHYLPKLVTFCEWEFDVELHSLRKVSIKGCPVLENFSLGIEIEGCSAPNLEAFTTDFQNNFEIGVHESVENSESEKPSFFCYKFFLSIFKGLKELEVHQFRGSLSLFTSSVSKNLDSLRRLVIWNCSEIVKVIEDEAEDEKVASRGEMTILFPKLKKLMLWNLPKLVSFCEWTCDVKFPSLRDCFIRDCSDMKSFTLGFITAPNLEYIQTDYRETVVSKDLNGALQQALALKQEEQDEDNEEEHEEEHEG